MTSIHLDEQMGWRGGEQQASYLVGGLRRRGERVIICGRPGSRWLEASHGAEGIERVALPFRNEVDLLTAWQIGRIAREAKAKIIHAHTSHTHTLALLARPFAGGAKVVVSRRVDFPPKSGPLNRWKYSAPDRIVAISDAIATILRAHGVSADRLRTVHSGIDPARFDVAALDRASLGAPADAPLLGNVAALVGHKDQRTLIAAMPAVLRALPTLRLVIAGEGNLRGALEAQIAELGVGHAVTLLGQRNDVPQLLRALDAFVLSSKEEGLGTSVLDAMACGLPVIACAGGGIPEMVIDGETGWLAPVGDAERLASQIVACFQSPDLAKSRAVAATARLHAQFTAERMVEGNLRVYSELR